MANGLNHQILSRMIPIRAQLPSSPKLAPCLTPHVLMMFLLSQLAYLFYHLLGILRSSFDQLQRTEQSMFMDVVVFRPNLIFLDMSLFLEWLYFVYNHDVQKIENPVCIYFLPLRSWLSSKPCSALTYNSLSLSNSH